MAVDYRNSMIVLELRSSRSCNLLDLVGPLRSNSTNQSDLLEHSGRREKVIVSNEDSPPSQLQITFRERQPHWYQSNYTDFYVFGVFQATIETIATEGTKLLFRADLSSDRCTTVDPASSSHFSFSRFSNFTARTCFLRTDTSVHAALSGLLDSGNLDIPSLDRLFQLR
jgi:hypothetical protein